MTQGGYRVTDEEIDEAGMAILRTLARKGELTRAQLSVSPAHHQAGDRLFGVALQRLIDNLMVSEFAGEAIELTWRGHVAVCGASG